MQSKYLIIFSVVGILALAIFNWVSSSHTEHELQASQTEASTSVTADNTSLGNQPKATLDKANAQINQANTETANKMADAEKATQ